MKTFVLTGLLSIGMTVILVGNSYAGSTKEEQQKAKRCVQEAQNYFRALYGKGYFKTDEGTGIYFYESHYNRKLRKCFVLLKGEIIPRDTEESEKHGNTTNKELWDIDETTLVGCFLKFDKYKRPLKCKVSEKECKSEREWDFLVRPYMEE